MDIWGIQWIGSPRWFEIYICNVSIIHLVNNLSRGSFAWSGCMSRSCLCPFNIGYIHYISCTYVKLLFFCWTCSFNIINVLLISNEFQRFRIYIFHALKFVLRIEGISTNSWSRKLNALGFSPFDIVYFHLIIWFIRKSEMKLSWIWSFNI